MYIYIYIYIFTYIYLYMYHACVYLYNHSKKQNNLNICGSKDVRVGQPHASVESMFVFLERFLTSEHE